METALLCIGVVVGALAAAFYFLSKVRQTETKLLLTEQALTAERQQLDEQRNIATLREAECKALETKLTEARIAQAEVQKQLEAESRRNAEETRLRQEQFAEQLKTVQEQFANLASKVLDQTRDRLKEANVEQVSHLTKPLDERLQQLQQALQLTHAESVRQTASLSRQLKEMGEKSDKIDQAATRLTNVIRGGNKLQGNWGERMLTELLESQGLREGIDYDVQQTITDSFGNTIQNEDSGKRMIPDVVLHYPGNEDVVIDAKMSIDAYYQYMNTEEEALKRKYADELARSVRTQAMNLAKKDYSSYIKPPRHAIDFVIMFVPNEGALQLALATQPRLWGEAFENRVFITSQQNLLAVLKMISMAWRQYAQSENQKRVYALAEELLKRVGEFVKRFEKVGKDIESLTKDYHDAHNKAFSGRQSIVQKANELKELGVKESANQPIPPVQASLEEDNETV